MPAPSKVAATILLTRPQAASERFAARLKGLAVVISPILRIVPVDHDGAALAAARGLVFTSEHAVAAAGPGRGRVAYCVGPRSGAVARAAGFQVIEGPGDAIRLEPILQAALEQGIELIHPHGRHIARDLPVSGMVVYDQMPVPLNDRACALLNDPAARVILPLFSPRSATLLAQAAQDAVQGGAVQGAGAALELVAISPAAAAAWSAAWDGPALPCRVAATPDADGLLAPLLDVAGRGTNPFTMG
ncbi:MAG: uroporphyrinogen-III synthase [Paracoccus sp. (in: a-proteobacteria)]|uniref:uroporphyrinogen-III synthase n=1 Tax=Paracoccus sp. TaxID=267 RepID=UPI0026DF2F97|nr:uroporphyrinogen-III synthase [Paracoccus sp. (in: a-proteobacteria)]MDO5621207.1 uroporphyrinogen-III synthase [Paracoccus sp. (in: a-proteobacteria)]